jgi:DDE superfamily endonuclease
MRKELYSKSLGNIRHRILKLSVPRPFCSPLKACKTSKSVSALKCRDKSSVSGESVSLKSAWSVSKIVQDVGDRVVFPPKVVVEIKALACQLPCERNLPFSRFSNADIAREAINSGIVASISGATVWRWLSADAIKPWQYRSWIFPRDPDFAQKAGRVLDLYQGFWNGKRLRPNDHVISADEKTSIQVRNRNGLHTATTPGRRQRFEFEYERAGALAYIAAWDIKKAKVFGLCAQSTGIEVYRRLVDLVMQQEPYRSANRVFWITDNGSSHRGQASVDRLAKWHPNAIQVHTPVHASWLNQIEIYFSVVQRKLLTPNDFPDLKTLEQQLLSFQNHYEKIARPFKWKFTKKDLHRILSKLSSDTLYHEKLAA